MRLIDADALIDDAMDRCCKDCDKRKGIKNGKYRIIYEIGEAPCRACDADDMIDDLESAPTVDAVEVVRCKDCRWFEYDGYHTNCKIMRFCVEAEDYCSRGERREDVQESD